MEEIKNKINLKDRTKYAIEKSKKIIKEHEEEKGDCSIEISLAYDMQYVEKYINQLETDKQKLIEKLEEDKMEQFDDYVIYLIESYLEIVKGVENERDKI